MFAINVISVVVPIVVAILISFENKLYLRRMDEKSIARYRVDKYFNDNSFAVRIGFY